MRPGDKAVHLVCQHIYSMYCVTDVDVVEPKTKLATAGMEQRHLLEECSIFGSAGNAQVTKLEDWNEMKCNWY